MFAELFFGYRSCLTIIRIHPEPVITFHKVRETPFPAPSPLPGYSFHVSYYSRPIFLVIAAWWRMSSPPEFWTRCLSMLLWLREALRTGSVISSMRSVAWMLNLWILKSQLLVFLQVFASMQDMLKTEEENPDRLLHNIRDLAQQLHLNVSLHLSHLVPSICNHDTFSSHRKTPTPSPTPRKSPNPQMAPTPESTSPSSPRWTGTRSWRSSRRGLPSTASNQSKAARQLYALCGGWVSRFSRGLLGRFSSNRCALYFSGSLFTLRLISS